MVIADLGRRREYQTQYWRKHYRVGPSATQCGFCGITFLAKNLRRDRPRTTCDSDKCKRAAHAVRQKLWRQRYPDKEAVISDRYRQAHLQEIRERDRRRQHGGWYSEYRSGEHPNSRANLTLSSRRQGSGQIKWLLVPIKEHWPYAFDDDGLLAAIDAVLSSDLPEQVRADVGQILALEVLEGRLALDAVARRAKAALRQ